MGNFNDHLKAGIISYILLIPIAVSVTILHDKVPLGTAFISLGVGPIVVIGALFPDVDHHASHPHRAFKKFTSIVASLGSIILVYYNYAVLQSMLTNFVQNNITMYIAIGSVILAIITYVGTSKLISILKPKHRGVTHRFITGIVFAVLLAGLVYSVCVLEFGSTPLVFACSAMTGIGFMFGFSSHLYVDGILFKLKTYTTVR